MMSQVAIPERSIMSARGCKHCGRKIYLQYLPIPGCKVTWLAFNHEDCKLHHCIVKPLDSGTKQLIEKHIEQMNPANTTNGAATNNNLLLKEMLLRMDTMIEILTQIKENINYIDR